jgi:simple sugar transport system permease protein/ribose transport system permease protein
MVTHVESLRIHRIELHNIIARYGTVGAAAIVFIVFALLSHRFLSFDNLSNILVQISVLMVVSSGLTVAVSSGEFDLSVGQVASLSGVLVAGLMIWSGLPVFAAIALSILAGVAIGSANAFLVTWLRRFDLCSDAGKFLFYRQGPVVWRNSCPYCYSDCCSDNLPCAFKPHAPRAQHHRYGCQHPSGTPFRH